MHAIDTTPSVPLAWLGRALFCLLPALGLPLCGAPANEPAPGGLPGKTLLEWSFDHEGDLEGWQPNGHLTGARVAGGVLACRAAGSDPILELRRPFEFPATPWQVIEVRMKADHDGEAEFFWSNTGDGRYGGFAQEKTTRFRAVGDNQWHTYRLFPFWHPEGRIVRLRFDLYDATTFAVDSIRILELPRPEPALEPEWDFGTNTSWRTVDGPSAPVAAGLLSFQQTVDAWLLAPPVGFAATERAFFSVRLKADRGRQATLFFATQEQAGRQTFDFPITADGREHTYNVDLLGASAWRGRIIALGLRPTDAVGAQTGLRWLKVSAEPQGAPQLRIESLALEETLPRAGRPARLAALVSNTGGEPALRLRADLTLPTGVKLIPSDPPSVAERVGFGEPVRFSWKLEAAGALTAPVRLRVVADNAEPATAGTILSFTPRPIAPAADYVPEPKPVRGPYEVGVYYFPGWKTMSQWQPLAGFPERRPALGWYREGDPEVADWHIKWAVEHGITFFAYDWYWSKGARQLEHGLHDGYFKARYRHLLKFCLLWANHNPPQSSSHEDCLAVTRYWIEHYFRQPEHLTAEGKPVMIIFSPDRLTSDLGSAGVARAFEAMRQECRQAGLKGLYLVACVGSAGQARQTASEGYDAVTAYNWPGLGMTGPGHRAPYETLLGGYQRNWAHILEQASTSLLLPLCGGWDSRPWHGENQLVRFGRTPELFRRHLQDARALLDRRAVGAPAAPTTGAQLLPMALIEAWNEWGEGSYIEPHQEFGFGYLDAVRDVFTAAPPPHTDFTPADVGLGPYDLPPAVAQTAWDFQQGDQGWGNVMDLTEVGSEPGRLHGRTTGRDPAFFGPPTQARAGSFPTVVVRMKLEREDGQSFQDSGQLFWRTSRLPESEASSVRFPVHGDGQWHDYALPVGQQARWRGLITRLRLDPCNQPGVRVSIASIRLTPAQ